MNKSCTIAVVIYKPSLTTVETTNKIFASVKRTLGNVQTIVVDNSPMTNREKFVGKVDRYFWNACYNIYWAGGINKAVEFATGEYFIHFLPTRAVERNPEWVLKLIAPLSNKGCGMAGPVHGCLYERVTGDERGLPKPDIHMQQAVFAARTEVLRKVPWGPNHPHAYSDVEHSINLMRAGYQLVNVPEVSSVADLTAGNPKAMFEAGTKR